MKSIALSFIILLFVSCKNDGGGVIKTTNAEAPPTIELPDNEFYGPFGGAINGDMVIPPASLYNPPLTTYDLDLMIADTPEGGTLIISQDIFLNYSLLIEKSITIIGDPNKRVKLTGKNLLNLIQSNSDNIQIKNFDIYLYNVDELIISPVNMNGDPLKSNVIFQDNRVFLSGKSSAKFLFNNSVIKNNSFFGLSNYSRNFSIVSIKGENGIMSGNAIFDNSLNYQGTILLQDVDYYVLDSNVSIAHGKGYFAALTIRQSSNINIKNNIFYDRNTNRIMNDGYSIDPNVDGSIGISIQESHDIQDQNQPNYIYATHPLLTDIGNNIGNGVTESNNIQLNNIQIISNSITPSQLFNNQSTLDFSPICLIGTNPTISITPNQLWNSYQTINGSQLYYAGAILPACL